VGSIRKECCRCRFEPDNDHILLHGFCDGSFKSVSAAFQRSFYCARPAWDNITRLANTRQTPVLRVIVVGAILFFQLVEWVFFIIWLWSDRTKDGNILFDIPVVWLSWLGLLGSELGSLQAHGSPSP